MYRFWAPILSRLAASLKAQSFVEVGSEHGYHTRLVLDYCKEHGGTLNVIEPFPKFDVEKWQQEYPEQFFLRKGLSLSLLPTIEKWDFILLDGDHNWYTVINELKAIEKRSSELRLPFPFIALHDVFWPYARRDLYYAPENIPTEFLLPHRKLGIVPGQTDLSSEKGINSGYNNAIYENTPQNGVLTGVEDFIKETELDLELKIVPTMGGLGLLFPKELRDENKEFSTLIDELDTPKMVSDLVDSIEADRLGILTSLCEKQAATEYYKGKLEEIQNPEGRKKAPLPHAELENSYEPERLRRLLSESRTRETKAAEFVQEAKQRRAEDLRLLQSQQSLLGKLQKEVMEFKGRTQPNLDDVAKSRDNFRCAFAKLHLALIQAKRYELYRVIKHLSDGIEDLSRAFQEIDVSPRYKLGRLLFALPRLLKRGQPLSQIVDQQNKEHLKWRKEHKRFFSKGAESRYGKINVEPRAVTAQFESEVLEDIATLRRSTKSLSASFEAIHRAIKGQLCSIEYEFGDFLLNKCVKRALRSGNRNAPWAPERAETLYGEHLGWKKMAEFSSPELRKHYNYSPSPHVPAAEAIYRKQMGLQAQKQSEAKKSNTGKHRIIQYIPRNPRNPYYSMIPEELMKRGVPIEFTIDPAQVIALLGDDSFEQQIVHFHQLEPFYHVREKGEDGNLHPNIELTAIRARSVLNDLATFKNCGAKLVWTKHNPLPHQRDFTDIDSFLIKSVSRIVDRVIVLGEHAREYMTDYLPKEDITTVLHPSFAGRYGEKSSREASREALGLPLDTFTFGLFGEIKPYKDLEFLIDAANQLSQTTDKEFCLVIAGHSSSPSYVEELERRAGKNVKLLLRRFADEEVAGLLGAFDASVFSFRDLWASSSVVLALSYEVPVIVPDLGCLPDYILHETNGLFYEHQNQESLVKRMHEMMSTRLHSHMSYMCKEFSSSTSVEKAGDEFEAVYTRVANG